LRTIRQLLAGEDEIQLAIRLALLALLIYWSFVVIRPFVPILAWSVVLAVAALSGVQLALGPPGNRPKLAATMLTVINLAIIIGPATWLGLAQWTASRLCCTARRRHAGRSVASRWRQRIGCDRHAIVRLWDQLRPICARCCNRCPASEAGGRDDGLVSTGDAGAGTLKFLMRSL